MLLCAACQRALATLLTEHSTPAHDFSESVLTMQPSPPFALPSFTGAITLAPSSLTAPTFGGITFDSHMIAELSGAPDGADVLFCNAQDYFGMQVAHACFRQPAQIHLSVQGNGSLTLHIDSIEIVQRGTGLATKMVERMARAAVVNNISHFCLQAVSHRGTDHTADLKNGVYAWVKLGFDGPLELEEYDYDLATPRLICEFETGQIRSVSQLMAHPEGPTFWAMNDRIVDMAFDLQPNSRSWQALSQRL